MTSKIPIACTLSPADLRARRQALLPGLAERATAIERVDGGLRLYFAPAPDIVSSIARVVDAERECCRFLQFAITVDADVGPIALTVTGPPEADELLQDLVANNR
jgi:hypothetical protein